MAWVWFLVASGAVAAACGGLSVIVVARRWAFVGEGFGHSGYGGAGTAWAAAALIPAAATPGVLSWSVPFGVLGAVGVAAVVIGLLTRGGRVSGDAAVGVLLVGSLAWGFLGREMFARRYGTPPGLADALLFGSAATVDAPFAVAAVCVAVAVAVGAWAFAKEFAAYALDPLLAQVGGVRVGLIHGLLLGMLAIVAAAGVRTVGGVLVTALLVLPGVVASLTCRRVASSVIMAVSVATAAGVGGVLMARTWPTIPPGPATVLLLLIAFAAAYAVDAVTRPTATGSVG